MEISSLGSLPWLGPGAGLAWAWLGLGLGLDSGFGLDLVDFGLVFAFSLAFIRICSHSSLSWALGSGMGTLPCASAPWIHARTHARTS